MKEEEASRACKSSISHVHTYTELNLMEKFLLLLSFQVPSAHKFEGNIRVEDDDQIVNDEEIDTNLNNSDDVQSEGGVSISKTYRPNDLKRWRQVPPVAENYGQPGEMGKHMTV